MHPALPALLDRLIPPDEHPSATQNGVLDFYASILTPERRELHVQALDALDGEAEHRYGRSFTALDAAEQDATLNDLDANRTQVEWPCEARAWLAQAVNLAAEGYYADPSNGANLNRASWEMVGFRRTIERPLVQEKLLPTSTSGAAGSREAAASSTWGEDSGGSSWPQGNVAPVPGGAAMNAAEASSTSSASEASASSPSSTSTPPSTASSASSTWDGFDALVIGAGAGGGAAACVLSEAGMRVLIIERGPDLGFDQAPRDHLRSQRLSLYGHNAGPDGNHPRVFVSPQGREATVMGWQGGYLNNAACVGGGTRVYGAQAW